MSDKYKENRVIPQFLHILMITILFLPFMAGMTSCGSDDKDDEPTVDPAEALYGTWSTEQQSISNDGIVTGHEYTFVFNTHGILWTELKSFLIGPGGGGTFISDPIEYKYEVVSNTINLYSMDLINTEPITILSYSLKDENLQLKYIYGEKPYFLSEIGNNSITLSRN